MAPNPGQPGGTPRVPPGALPPSARPQPLPPAGAQPQAPRPVPVPPGGLPPSAAPAAPQLPPTVGAPPVPRPAPVPLPPGGSVPPAPRPAPQPVSKTAGSAPRPMPISAGGPRPQPVTAGQKPVVRAPAANEELSVEEELKRSLIKMSPPMLVSLIVHLVLIVALGLFYIHRAVVPRGEPLEAVSHYEDGQQTEHMSEVEIPNPLQIDATESEFSPDLPVVENPAPPTFDPSFTSVATSTVAAATVATMSTGLDGRQAGTRNALVGKYGGNANSEAAVVMGLEWLDRNQDKKTGSWSMTGPYPDAAKYENREAATAMALLAFQGQGNTHKEGRFQKTVDAGLRYLLRKQSGDGNFFQDDTAKKLQALYTQAQCTMVVCESFAMTRDEKLREPAERAIAYCIESQNAEFGGWRYRPRDDSDTSVTGWMVMALQSAKMGGIKVPPEVFENIRGYLDKATTDDGSQYSYLPGQGAASRVMTAEALLCRQYLGWSQNDPRMLRGADWLLTEENQPTLVDRDVYYWYYGTQMMHHLEGKHWEDWNAIQRDLLVNSQETKGRDRGSWYPGEKNKEFVADTWGQTEEAGRLYMTCFSLYILEVYYRHLPLYSLPKNAAEDGEAQAAGGQPPANGGTQ